MYEKKGKKKIKLLILFSFLSFSARYFKRRNLKLKNLKESRNQETDAIRKEIHAAKIRI